jgi:hypothetical protein
MAFEPSSETAQLRAEEATSAPPPHLLKGWLTTIRHGTLSPHRRSHHPYLASRKWSQWPSLTDRCPCSNKKTSS